MIIVGSQSLREAAPKIRRATSTPPRDQVKISAVVLVFKVTLFLNCFVQNQVIHLKEKNRKENTKPKKNNKDAQAKHTLGPSPGHLSMLLITLKI